MKNEILVGCVHCVACFYFFLNKICVHSSSDVFDYRIIAVVSEKPLKCNFRFIIIGYSLIQDNDEMHFMILTQILHMCN